MTVYFGSQHATQEGMPPLHVAPPTWSNARHIAAARTLTLKTRATESGKTSARRQPTDSSCLGSLRHRSP